MQRAVNLNLQHPIVMWISIAMNWMKWEYVCMCVCVWLCLYSILHSIGEFWFLDFRKSFLFSFIVNCKIFTAIGNRLCLHQVMIPAFQYFSIQHRTLRFRKQTERISFYSQWKKNKSKNRFHYRAENWLHKRRERISVANIAELPLNLIIRKLTWKFHDFFFVSIHRFRTNSLIWILLQMFSSLRKFVVLSVHQWMVVSDECSVFNVQKF